MPLQQSPHAVSTFALSQSCSADAAERRRASSIKERAGPIKFIGRRHDDDRYAAAQPFEGNGELALGESSSTDTAHVSETKHVSQQFLDKTDGGAERRGVARREFGIERVADAEVARDLIAQREALGDGVITLALPGRIMPGDAPQHRRRN